MSWRRFFHRDETDAEQRVELESYLDIATQENIARGMAPEQARQSALRKLGNPTRIREEIYLMNGLSIVTSLVSALRYWLRTARREPLFTATAVLTLALGIGAATAIFSVVNGVLLKPLSYPQPERLVGLWLTSPGLNFGGDLNMAPSLMLTYREHNKVFDALGAWSSGAVSVTGLERPEQVRSLNVTYGVLDALQVPPLFGRWISEADDTPGTPEVAILSNGYWQRRFGGDRNILGRTLLVQGRPTRIIGVMPESFDLMGRNPEIILPLRFERARLFLGNFAYLGIARLKPGATLAAANADVARMLPIWLSSWPTFAGSSAKIWENARLGPALHPLTTDVLGNVAGTLWVVMGTVALVLFIACANVANLMLVRNDSRRREKGVRAALGAGRVRLLTEALGESLVLGVIGGALGVGVAYAGVLLLRYVEPGNLPRLREIAMDRDVFLFVGAGSVVIGLLFGVISGWNVAGSRILSWIRDGGRGLSEGPSRQAFRNGLVVTQVAFSLILLVTSGLMIRTFQEQRKVQPGVTGMSEVQTFRLQIPVSEAKEPERLLQMQRQIIDRLTAIPGVSAAGFGNSVPLDFNNSNDPIDVEGKEIPAGENPVPRRYKFVAPGFLASTGTRIVAGRDFTWEETHNMRNVALVSENLARELFGSAQSALGKRIRNVAVNQWREIVGVVEDVRDDGLERSAPAIAYWPVALAGFYAEPVTVRRSAVFTVRGPGAGTEGLMNAIRQAVWSVNPNLPLARVMTLQEIYNQSTAQTNFAAVVLSIAAAVALLLGVIGIYGVIAYSVTQRRREVGIRLALGATAPGIRWMFVRKGVLLCVTGIAFGLFGAAGVGRAMKSMLFGVTPGDLVTFTVTPIVLLLAGLSACYFPSRRAARVDPAETLRSE